MNKLIDTIKHILAILKLWTPAPKPNSGTTGKPNDEPPRGFDRPDITDDDISRL